MANYSQQPSAYLHKVFKDYPWCFHNYHQNLAQIMVCVKRSLGVSTTRNIEIESRLRNLCLYGADSRQYNHPLGKPKTKIPSRNYLIPTENRSHQRNLHKVSTRYSSPQELKQRVELFIKKPQPMGPFSSLKVYKNPAEKLLRQLMQETQQNEPCSEDHNDGEEERTKDRLPLIVVSGNTYKSKWVEAREWYYNSPGDGICNYIRAADREKLPRLTLSDVFDERGTNR